MARRRQAARAGRGPPVEALDQEQAVLRAPRSGVDLTSLGQATRRFGRCVAAWLRAASDRLYCAAIAGLARGPGRGGTLRHRPGPTWPADRRDQPAAARGGPRSADARAEARMVQDQSRTRHAQRELTPAFTVYLPGAPEPTPRCPGCARPRASRIPCMERLPLTDRERPRAAKTRVIGVQPTRHAAACRPASFARTGPDRPGRVACARAVRAGISHLI